MKHATDFLLFLDAGISGDARVERALVKQPKLKRHADLALPYRFTSRGSIVSGTHTTRWSRVVDELTLVTMMLPSTFSALSPRRLIFSSCACRQVARAGNASTSIQLLGFSSFAYTASRDSSIHSTPAPSAL